MEYRIENPPPLNQPALHAELAAALPEISDGFATDSLGLRLIFTRALTPTEEATARAIVAAHDASVLTEVQQQRANRLTTLETLRADVEAMDLSQSLSAEDADKLARYNGLRGLLER